jgi:mannose-6-phosphate isomerase-like protein (cupin superfamily)
MDPRATTGSQPEGTRRAAQVTHLEAVPLESVVAHGGQGKILFRRLFEGSQFEGPWNFVDYAEVPPGASIGRHTHGADEELYLILEGQGRMTLGEREVDVRAGHVIINPRGGTHGLVNRSNQVVRLFVVEIACVGKPAASSSSTDQSQHRGDLP